MRLPPVLADRHLGLSFTYAGVNAGWVFAGGKLVEQFFILVHDSVPVIKIADPIGSPPAQVFGKIRTIFNKLDFRSQVGGISKQEAVARQHFSIERVVMRQDAVAET